MRLRGERVLIRPFAAGDITAMRRIWGDTETMRFLEPPFSPQQAEVFLRQAGLCDPPLIYALSLPPSPQAVGHVIFHPLAGEQDVCELGWVLRRDLWGRGLASEATALLVSEARRRGYRQALLECVPAQTATRRIAQKLGFSLLGVIDGCEQMRLTL